MGSALPTGDAAGVEAPRDREHTLSGGVPVDQGGPSFAEGWVLPVKHFSATSLSMLAVCPRQYQQRYIHHRKERPGQAQIVGNAFHATAEYNLRQKIDSHVDLDITTLVDYCADVAFDSAVREAEEAAATEVVWDDRGDAKLQSIAVVTGFRNTISPRIQPLSVEHEFEVTVGATVSLRIPPVIGKIDVETEESIIDLKSSKRKHSKIKPQWKLQGRIYQLAQPKDTVFETITTKGVAGDSFVIPFSHMQWLQTDKWVETLAWTANHYYKTYGPDDPWPMTGIVHDWRCDWCGYKGDCPAWRS